MSSEHFAQLAAELKANKPQQSAFDMDSKSEAIAYSDSLAQWRRDVRTVARVCAEFNPLLDWHAFMRAADAQ